jgi:hypothetical protein
MFYRNVAARSALRAISSSNTSVARSTLVNNVFKAPLTSAARFPARPTTSPSLALAARKPVTTTLVRYASTSSKVRESSSLIVIQPFADRFVQEGKEGEEDVDMMAGIKSEAVRAELDS